MARNWAALHGASKRCDEQHLQLTAPLPADKAANMKCNLCGSLAFHIRSSQERESVAVQASLGRKIRSGDRSEIVEEGGRIGLYWTIQCGIETVCSSRQAEIL